MSDKAGLEILPIVKTVNFLSPPLIFLAFVGGLANHKELGTVGLIAYIIGAIAVIMAVWYVEEYFWLGPEDPNKGSLWEVIFFEGCWKIRALDERQSFWTSPFGNVIRIDPQHKAGLGEPEIIYLFGEDRLLVTHPSQIVDGHVIGLITAAQYDLHGKQRKLLGPTGALGLLRYTITDEGAVYVATRQIVGGREQIIEHGELFNILKQARTT